MNKSSTCLLLFTVAVVSIPVGGCSTAAVLNQRLAVSDATSAARDIALLRLLHKGDTNAAIDKLEQDLDRRILLLETQIEDIPEQRRDPAVVSVLEKARAYRAEHPYARNKKKE
jgi:hypothetical protein